MCGIAGYQGRYDATLLDRMSDAIAHRGPDGAGRVVLAEANPACPVGLAHRRLAILDLSAEGAQPMTVACARCGSSGHRDLALVYNGEVYNYRELRRELEERGHTFHSHTDSEVLLHLYAEEGTEMLSRLNGIFAFALYDGRGAGQRGDVRRGDLFVARDPLGVKPLYFSAPPEGFLFASELKSLLRHPGVRRDLDHTALHYQLAYLWTPAPRTMLRDVQKLPPGTALLVRGGTVAREWTYYKLPHGQAPLRGSADEIAGELRARVATAVDRQMMADVPVGAFLSGGLDSSAVVAMMRRAQPDRTPTCYTIGFRGVATLEDNPQDLPYARRVAEHLGARLEVIEIDPSIITDRLDQVLYALDEPQADPAPINALLIAERARQDGIPVLLSGAGGDDIFTGYRRHRALALERYWSWLPQPVRLGLARGARTAMAGRGLGGMHTPLLRRAAKAFAHADLTADRRAVAYFWWSAEELRRSLYSPALAAELAGVDTAAPLLATLGGIPTERDPMSRMLHLEGRHFLADHNLNYTDKMGMAAGIEVRVPLLDLELVDFASRIPSALKQRGNVGKAIFKRAMEPLLPRDVIYRPKSGFGAPLRRWLRVELRDRVEDTLSPASLTRRGLFDPAAVQRLLALDRAGKVDGGYTIFALMCVELWCRLFVDGSR